MEIFGYNWMLVVGVALLGAGALLQVGGLSRLTSVVKNVFTTTPGAPGARATTADDAVVTSLKESLYIAVNSEDFEVSRSLLDLLWDKCHKDTGEDNDATEDEAQA